MKTTQLLLIALISSTSTSTSSSLPKAKATVAAALQFQLQVPKILSPTPPLSKLSKLSHEYRTNLNLGPKNQNQNQNNNNKNDNNNNNNHHHDNNNNKNQQQQRRRRDFLASCLQGGSLSLLVLQVPKEVVAVATSDVDVIQKNTINRNDINDINNINNNDNWVGTSLPLLSIEEAAAEAGVGVGGNNFDSASAFAMGRWPDPILRRSASKINFGFDSHFENSGNGNGNGNGSGSGNTRTSLKVVANKLRRTARVNKAVGLAAQQW